MKSSNKIHSWLSRRPLHIGATSVVFAAATILVCVSATSQAASNTWIAGGNGTYTDPTKWTGGVNVPNGAADIAAIEGTNSVVAFNTTVTLLTLNLAQTASGGAPVFNQTGGELTVGTLGFGGAGGSRNPNYNLSGGTLNISSTFSWGNGSNAKFNLSSGTANFNGGSLSIGVANGARGSINLTGGIFNANTVGQINLANNAGGDSQATIDLSGDSQFHANAATLVFGQFGAATGTNTFATLNMSGTSSLSAAVIVLGGNNTGSAVYGVINLNGGTITAGSIRKGNSSIAASSTAQVLHANGGTVKASTHANNSNYFLNTFVDLAAGGLKFDTNSNDVTVANVLSGVGGLTKLGAGTLTLSNATLSYAGNTVVTEGTLSLTTGTLPDTANVSIAGGDVAKLDLSHGLEDAIGTLTLGGAVKPNGVYGSSSSAAPIANQDDAYFSGTGTVRVGPVTATPRNLVWEGLNGQSWSTSEFDTNFLDGATQVAFRTFDHVAFNDIPNDPEGVDRRFLFIGGAVQPSSITFNNSAGFDYSVSGGNVGGTTGLVKNGAGAVSWGGVNSSFTGPINVNAGKLIALDNKSFGVSSAIAIASGAQIDLNGKGPGAIYTFTLNGPGPAGSGAIVNGGVDILNLTAVKNLVLNADSVIGNDGGRLDICNGGVLTGNSHTLTKIGNNGMAFRGNASASPVAIIASGGSIWAEGTDAFGGSTGTLTVKSGARAGSFGVRAMTSATTVESGGMINNLGAGKGTWSGALSLAGNVTFESGGTAADQIDSTGTVTGTANLTKQGTALVTITHPTYVGNTTVTGGQLSVLNPELADGGSVSIATAGTLSLPHGLNDTVSTLFLDGVQVAAGTYGATGNLTAQFTTDRIVGAGKLVVTNGPVAAGAFETWAAANITNPAYASLKGRTDDPDTDGFTNLQEFLYGTDPQTNTATLTQLTGSAASLVLHWIQRDSGAIYQLQQGATLAENPWPASAVVPVNSTDQTGVLTGYTRKEAAIPVDSARKFLRVQGVEN